MSREQRRVRDVYNLKKDFLGKGNFGCVIVAEHKGTGERYAAKCILKKDSWSVEKFRRRVAQEVSSLQLVHRHRNIIELIDHLDDGVDDNKHWVIMKLATGGELWPRVISKFESQGGYTEKEVAAIIVDVLRACAYMHARQIVHCDLKPQNILYEHEGADSPLCVADFGFAQLRGEEHLTQYRGTLDYMAPELLRDEMRYDEKADVWSVGCIMYVLLSGQLPFRRKWDVQTQAQADANVRECILSGKVDMSSRPWELVQRSTQDLLKRMLSLDPADRPTALQCLQDEWFEGGATDKHELAEILTELKRYNSSRGQYGYTSHSMAGIFTSHASVSTLTALGSSQSFDVSNGYTEGGIQSAVSLGLSKNVDEQICALSILANKAQKSSAYQRQIIEEGGVLLVCSLIMKSGKSNVTAGQSKVKQINVTAGQSNVTAGQSNVTAGQVDAKIGSNLLYTENLEPAKVGDVLQESGKVQTKEGEGDLRVAGLSKASSGKIQEKGAECMHKTEELYFFASLMLNHIANNTSLRMLLADEHVRHDNQNAAQVIPVLVKLAMDGSTRVLNNAVCALARLALEEKLHKRLMDSGAIPLMVLVGDPKQSRQDPFAKSALNALEFMLRTGALAGPEELDLRVHMMSSCARNVDIRTLLEECLTEQGCVDQCSASVQRCVKERKEFLEMFQAKSEAAQKAGKPAIATKKFEDVSRSMCGNLPQAQGDLCTAESRLMNAKACHNVAIRSASVNSRVRESLVTLQAKSREVGPGAMSDAVCEDEALTAPTETHGRAPGEQMHHTAATDTASASTSTAYGAQSRDGSRGMTPEVGQRGSDMASVSMSKSDGGQSPGTPRRSCRLSLRIIKAGEQGSDRGLESMSESNREPSPGASRERTPEVGQKRSRRASVKASECDEGQSRGAPRLSRASSARILEAENKISEKTHGGVPRSGRGESGGHTCQSRETPALQDARHAQRVLQDCPMRRSLEALDKKIADNILLKNAFSTARIAYPSKYSSDPGS